MATIRVKSEVVGKVWKIQAQPGAAVGKDEAVMILECMKMEIPVEAPRAGTLKELLVKEGDTVAEGQDVAILEG